MIIYLHFLSSAVLSFLYIESHDSSRKQGPLYHSYFTDMETEAAGS